MEIYLMNADGSNPVNLTNNPADDKNPAWSSDGMQIVFESDRDGNNEIFVMNADGSRQTNLTQSPGYDSWPVWSSE
jgi:TolB protein